MNPSWREKREHGVESPQDHYQAGASGVPQEENGRHPKERPRASQFAHPSLGITEPLTQSGTNSWGRQPLPVGTGGALRRSLDPTRVSGGRSITSRGECSSSSRTLRCWESLCRNRAVSAFRWRRML